MHRLLLKWSENSADLLLGKGLAGEKDDSDCVFAELLQSNDEDNQLVCELLQMLCKSFWLVADRMVGDHLEDGVFSEKSPATLNSETVNLPKTNACSERYFALLDRYAMFYYVNTTLLTHPFILNSSFSHRLLREKPNCSMVALESMIMFKRNKTAKWLKTKSSEEKEKLFKACIKMGRQQRQVHCQREEGIRVHRQQVLKEREQALIAKQRKEKQKKEELCQQVLREGYWNSEAKIRAGLHVVCGKSESRCRKYLEVQLRFRQHVLNRRTSTNHFSVYQKREKSCHLKNYLTIY
jgi:hypothetical protein